MSKKFVIPVYWEVGSTVEVAAETFEEAVKIITEMIDEVPLGESDFISGTYKIDAIDEATSRELRHIGGVYIDENRKCHYNY